MQKNHPSRHPATAPRIALLWAAAAAAPAAWAQGAPVGAVAYAPLAAPAAVPTLSQWGLLVLVLLLAAAARHLLRHAGHGVVRAIVPGLLACAALLCMPWGGQAIAVPSSDVPLDNPAGGVADIPDHPDLERAFADYLHAYEVRNTTDRPQRITAVSVTAAHRIQGPGDETRCTVGQTLAPMASCHLVVGRPH
ncbi:midcut-by-XrtH protein [Acidovorax sp. sif1233]|uniref:midcut-by-XrtH protein n=1 Tax=unclassified Acidovorax TaxID=2684926 RepID=UPI001C46AD99|nr:MULTISPECIES: midcut-by-XrtH protein [unclassified Acidovorax]MBV7429630.1 midcut-by-XrtH protein [Acidovorax sp. sif0732]MBV7448708.1 midcut-by-XrtH protein [Acidovorax sp. sif0715]MBV7456372.1 midcut-by-XrtH protein [Acidovorax sp. sif1233]